MRIVEFILMGLGAYIFLTCGFRILRLLSMRTSYGGWERPSHPTAVVHLAVLCFIGVVLFAAGWMI